MQRLFLVTFLLFTACPGPRDTPLSEDEFGKTFFWEVTGSSVSFEDCTDAESWTDQIQAPQFQENTFLMYRVSDDGMSAVAQTCETTRANSCSPNPLGITYAIDGSTLTWDPEKVLNNELSATCSLFQDELWTLEDFGDSLTLDAAVAFSLEGNEMTCDNINNAVIEESENGLGIDGCVATISVETSFFTSDE